MEHNKGTVGSARRVAAWLGDNVTKILGAGATAVIVTLILAVIGFVREDQNTQSQDAAQATVIALQLGQLQVLQEMATVSANNPGTGPEATQAAERIIRLQKSMDNLNGLLDQTLATAGPAVVAAFTATPPAIATSLPALTTSQPPAEPSPTPLPTESAAAQAVPANSFRIKIGDSIAAGVPAAGAGRLDAAGEEDVYLFDAAAGQRIFLYSLGADSADMWIRLLDPAEQQLSQDNLGRVRREFTLNQAGEYRLIVGGKAAGAYQFKVWDVPAPQQFTIQIGDTIADGTPAAGAGRIESPGARDVYTFEAKPGQRVFLYALRTDTSEIRLRLSEALGRDLYEQSVSIANQEVALDLGGQYVLTAVGNNGSTGAYSFRVWDVPPPQQFTLKIGDSIADGSPGPGAGRIESPGAQDVYTFEARAGQHIFLYSMGADDNGLRVRVSEALGRDLFEQSVASVFQEVALDLGGQYLLSVFGGRVTGAYRLKLWDVPPPQQFDLKIGDTVAEDVPAPGAGRIESPGVRDVYTFEAKAGQNLVLEILRTDDRFIRVSVTDPAGTEILHTDIGRNTSEIKPLQDGLYSLTIGGGQATGTYRFQLRQAPEP